MNSSSNGTNAGTSSDSTTSTVAIVVANAPNVRSGLYTVKATSGVALIVAPAMARAVRMKVSSPLPGFSNLRMMGSISFTVREMASPVVVGSGSRMVASERNTCKTCNEMFNWWNASVDSAASKTWR